MQVVLIVAQSLDGFITKHDEPGAGWASEADQRWFDGQLRQFDGQIMARTTFETVRKEILGSLNHDSPKRLIMTRQPEQFSSDAVAGQLEFSSAEPASLLQRLGDLNVSKCALLGGAAAHDAFLDAGLVDEIRVTIEPRLFGTGTPVIRQVRDHKLSLLQFHRLPGSDSLVAHYTIAS